MHPLTVLFTVYVPAVLTVIEEAVDPLLHNNVPVAVVDRVEVPQPFTTLTVGADGSDGELRAATVAADMHVPFFTVTL